MNCATQTGQQSSVLCTLLSSFTPTAFTSGWRDEEKKKEETETETEGERESKKATCFTGLSVLWVHKIFRPILIISILFQFVDGEPLEIKRFVCKIMM